MENIMRENDHLRQEGYRIAVAVLAGGQSKRMGRPKDCVVISGDGRTFLEKICDEADDAAGSCISGRYLSVRKDQDIARSGYINVTDKHEGIGPMGGLFSVLLRAKEDGFDAVLALACDLIGYEHSEIIDICRHYRGETVLFARTEGQFLQPLASIYSVKALPEFENLIEKKDYRLRDLKDIISDVGYYDSCHDGYYENCNSLD
ncbi:MAG: molybdenum cofactor guanylyltransferase [Lachnospiraceae bacterium]|nr:molybdenum cofactor guanylyltransferase [Lachnospiraceae bacterium]